MEAAVTRWRRDCKEMLMSIAVSPFLRRVLALDAIATGATALLAGLGAGVLEPLLGLPASLMHGAGLVLAPFVGLVAWTAFQPRVPSALVWTIILCNAAWVLASIALLGGGWVHPTLLGMAFVIAQSVVVGIFAELEYVGLRRSAAIA
jgi:hypothetical protein